MSEAPERIFLQYFTEDGDKNEVEEITWSDVRVEDNDPEYILVSEYDKLRAENSRLLGLEITKQLAAENTRLREELASKQYARIMDEDLMERYEKHITRLEQELSALKGRIESAPLGEFTREFGMQETYFWYRLSGNVDLEPTKSWRVRILREDGWWLTNSCSGCW